MLRGHCFRVVFAVGLVVAAAGCASSSAHVDSTLKRTYVDPRATGVLEAGPGEPPVDRTNLAPRVAATKTLATFAQLTDAHVLDEESPARVEWLDRLGAPSASRSPGRVPECRAPHADPRAAAEAARSRSG